MWKDLSSVFLRSSSSPCLKTLVKPFQSTNAKSSILRSPVSWNMKVSAGRTPPVLGLENSPMWLILGPVHTSPKASATTTGTCSMNVECVVEMVTSAARIPRHAITTRKLVATMAAATFHSQVAKNVWMVYLPQLTRTVTASMIAMRFLAASIRLRATTMKQQTLQMVLASMLLISTTAVVFVCSTWTCEYQGRDGDEYGGDAIRT